MRQVWFERDPDVKDPAVINTDETCRCLRMFRSADEVPRSLFKTQNPGEEEPHSTSQPVAAIWSHAGILGAESQTVLSARC